MFRIGNGNRSGMKMNDTPGPGDYNLGSSKSGPKISMSNKGKTSSFG